MAKKKLQCGLIYPVEYKIEKRVREDTGQEVPMWCGTHQWADRENANRRIYPRGLWENLFRNEPFLHRLETRQLSAQLGHPEGEGIVNPRYVSHVTTWLEMRPDGEIYGESEILPTPDGNILLTLLESDVTLGISSRGWGDSYLEGEVEVLEEEGYELGGFDGVVEPSVDVAFPKLQKIRPQAIKALASRVYDKIGTYEHDETVRPYLREELVRWEGLFKRSTRLTEALKTESRGTRSLVEEIDRVLQPVQPTRVRVPEAIKPDKDTSRSESIPSNKGEKKEREMDELAKLTATVTELKASLQTAVAKKDEEIGALKRTIQRLNNERETLTNRVQASENVIDRFRKRDEVSKRRIEAGEKALSEALRLGRRLKVQAKSTSKRLTAAESLINASLSTVKRERSDRLKSTVVRLCQRFEDPKKARKILENARSVKEAYSMARDLRGFGGNGRKGSDVDLTGLHSRVSRPSGPSRVRKTPKFSSDPGEQAMFTDSLRLTQGIVENLATKGKAKLEKK